MEDHKGHLVYFKGVNETATRLFVQRKKKVGDQS